MKCPTGSAVTCPAGLSGWLVGEADGFHSRRQFVAVHHTLGIASGPRCERDQGGTFGIGVDDARQRVIRKQIIEKSRSTTPTMGTSAQRSG